MKLRFQFLLILFCAIWSITISAQNTLTYGFSYGPNFQIVKEARYSSNFRTGLGMATDLRIGLISTKANKELRISFIYNKTGKTLTSPMISLIPDVRFSYLHNKQFKSFRFGTYADVGTFLGFRSGRWDSVNGISYAIWSGVGVMAQYDRALESLGENTTFKFSIANPILSYLVRPASVRFPYPDNFLEQENFNFNLDGLGGSVLSSGNIKTINSFVNLKLEAGLDFQLKSGPWHLGIYYCLDYMYVQEELSLIQFNNQIKFLIKKY